MNAFPIPDLIQDRNGDYSLHCEGGLTKRELFAAMAMQGALGGAPGSHLHPYNLANESVMYADALLAELAKESAQGGKSDG